MSEPFEIETPESVKIDFKIAGLGSRFLAAILDTFCIACYLGAVLYAALAVGAASAVLHLGAGGLDLARVLLIFGVFLTIWGYYILLESIWHGQTIGKRTFKIRVIKTNGYAIGFQDSFIRNIVRFADFLPLFYGIGVVTMFISRESRRLGDYAAGTLVVREKQRVTLETIRPLAAAPPEEQTAPRGSIDPEELSWNVDALTPEDLELVRAYLQRAPELPVNARTRLGREISVGIALRIAAREPFEAQRFLERVLALHDGE